MAKTAYPKGAEKMLNAAINFTGDTIKVALLKDAYAYNAAHEFFSSISSNVVGTPQTLSSKSTAGGAFDGADADFGSPAAGDTVNAVAFYKDTGNPATSPLLIYSTQFTGFPFVTSGSNVTIPWSNGVGKIFTLVAP